MAEIKIGEWRSVPNIGGIRQLRLIRLIDVETLTPPSSGVNVLLGSIVLSDTAEIVDIRFADRSCSYQVNDAESEAGKRYEIQISAEIPKVRSDLLTFFSKYEQYRWIAAVNDYNDNCFVLGAIDCNGLQMQLSYSSGSRPNDRNANRVSLVGASWYPLFTVNF